ncbi:dethiobiotin synthase [Mucilaginibacter gossypii]|uniref:dethiobiotin synthase n=1 Tax=Mucilaginibacter gossypii TaxID=551996 RepID=UPI000DCDDF4B|nr:MULTISPECIES: dethiobiotin synthase [Mucilaginibacter]QTE39248.1 dethiobiotin synthase [Mucilaginibacter gossypii]RAV60452.1 dethiobiotin synthase [Mucilaginibacter rubeus]
MPDKQPIFISGIDTGIGKTLVSAILTEKLNADYWKPIQSGDLDNSDTLKVKNLISNPVTQFFPEAYALTQPFSPHKSAALDKVTIDLENIVLPKTDNQLIIEGAGGLMVPLNDNFLIIDLIKQLNAKVILVSKHYLGSINHTLLSLHALKKYGIPVMGVIFNGDKDIYSKSYILDYSEVVDLGQIPEFKTINKKTVKEAGKFITL